MEKLNSFSANESLTLFVINDEFQLVGTITDGDIRRSLINNISIENTVMSVVCRGYKHLYIDDFNISDLIAYRESGIELLPILDNRHHVVDIINFKKEKSYLPIDLVLMAGGKGERLRPLTERIPKPLLPLGGKPIIDHIIIHVLSYGIKHVSVTMNYLSEQIEEHFSKPINNIKVTTILEPQFLGTIGSIKYIKEFYNDTILLMNSDAITDLNIEDFYLHFMEHDADMSIAAIPYNISIPYGIFDLDGRNVTGVFEKPTYNYYANSGIYLIKRKLLDLIPRDTFFNATDFMELLINKGYNVIRFPFNGIWMDIGSPQEYQKAQDAIRHIR